MIPVAIQLGDSNDIYMYRNMTIINHWQSIFTLMVINKIDPTVFCYLYCFFHVSPILVQDWVQKSTLKGKLHYVLMIYSDRLHDCPKQIGWFHTWSAVAKAALDQLMFWNRMVCAIVKTWVVFPYWAMDRYGHQPIDLGMVGRPWPTYIMF